MAGHDLTNQSIRPTYLPQTHCTTKFLHRGASNEPTALRHPSSQQGAVGLALKLRAHDFISQDIRAAGSPKF